MTQIAPIARPERAQNGGPDRERGPLNSTDGTHAGAFSHKPTAAIDDGSGRGDGQGEGRQKEPVQFARDPKTGELRAVSRGSGRARLEPFPSSSPLRLIGSNAVPAVYERETKADLNRKDYIATVHHPHPKYSSLLGARITFGDDDSPFNAGVPFDGRTTTLPEDEHAQMMQGMLDARLNRGPVSWGSRLGAF